MVKRFYKNVTVEQSEVGFKVLCDGKSLKCGGSQDLIVPNLALAEMLAAEWDTQDEEIDIKQMHVTDFLTGLNSLDESGRAKLVADSVAFIDTDVLFYRAPYPASLTERQNSHWDKVLIWAGSKYGISFAVTDSISPLRQSERTVYALSHAIESLGDFELLCFYKFSSLTTSVLLGLSVINKELSAEQAFRLSRLDEDFQNEFWGKDETAAKATNMNLNDMLITEKIFTAGKQ